MLIWIWFSSMTSWAGTLDGMLEDEAGEAVSNVAVVAYDQRFGYAYTFTDDNGVYRFDALPDNWYRIRAVPLEQQPWHEMWASGTLDVCASPIWYLGNVDVDVPTQILSLGERLSGRIVGPDGGPLPNMKVRAELASGEPRTQSRETVSGEDGTFELVGLPPEGESSTNWTLFIDGVGVPRQYLGASYTFDGAEVVDVVEAVELGDVSILAGMSVRGRVVSDGEPVDAGDVHVYSPSQVKAVPVDALGQFEVNGLPPGEALPWFRGEGFAFTYYPDADRPGERLESVAEGETIQGVELNVPLERKFYGQLIGEGDLSGVSVMMINDARTVGHGADVLEDGSFVVSKLHPGEYTLQVSAADEGYRDEEVVDETGSIRWFTVPEDEDGMASIPLREAATVFGEVVARDTGRPVYGARIVATDASGSPGGAAFTDSNGQYALSGLVGGDYTLHVQYDPFCGDDPNWVSVYFSDARHLGDASFVSLSNGERFEWSPSLGPDMEHDGMDDVWETENGLDPAVRDGDADADGDGRTNLDEYLLGTDPQGVERGGCGCNVAGGFSAFWLTGCMVLPLWMRRRFAH